MTVLKRICGDDSSMVLLGGEHLCDTIVAGNKYISRNKITEIKHSVLYYLHIGGTNYIIHLRKA